MELNFCLLYRDAFWSHACSRGQDQALALGFLKLVPKLNAALRCFDRCGESQIFQCALNMSIHRSRTVSAQLGREIFGNRSKCQQLGQANWPKCNIGIQRKRLHLRAKRTDVTCHFYICFARLKYRRRQL